MGEPDEALADFNEAIRLDPKFVRAYWSRGAACLLQACDGAAASARSCLDINGWSHELSPYMSLVGHLGHLQMHRDSEARQVVDEAATKCDTSAWPYPIIRYLRHEIGEKELWAAIDDKDVDKMTVARTHIGLDHSLSGRPEQALLPLHWVEEHGHRDGIEYELALAEIDRIEGRKAVASRP